MPPACVVCAGDLFFLLGCISSKVGLATVTDGWNNGLAIAVRATGQSVQSHDAIFASTYWGSPLGPAG